MAASIKPTTPSEDPGPTDKSRLYKKFVAECLASINEYRAMHRADPLTYNEEIAKVSKAWAEHLANGNKPTYNPQARHNGIRLGETIATHWTSNNSVPYEGRITVDMWYNESKTYNFLTHKVENTDNFTQMVWKATKEIGLGLAQSKDGTWAVVANYYPPGNVGGVYTGNVLPQVEGSKL